MHRTPTSTLFPYTTLFRSGDTRSCDGGRMRGREEKRTGAVVEELDQVLVARDVAAERTHRLRRSEEHTSELQSRLQLVCRLLLEKKNCKNGTAPGAEAPVA